MAGLVDRSPLRTRRVTFSDGRKVNGHDLSKSTHEEAVEAFRTAKEPIVVEVLRRTVSGGNRMRSKGPAMVSISTQTEDFTDRDYYGEIIRPNTPPPFLCFNGNGSLCQPSSRVPVAFSPSDDLGLTDLEFAANGFEHDFDEAFDDEKYFEMDYEEVTLHRTSSSEKVGLTLCYGSADDDVTDIFISEIEPYSIAAQCGSIREGDQILQINGVDVHNREQAIKLFSENTSDITLVLVRPQIQMDDGFMDERCVLDDIPMEMLERHHHRNLSFGFTQGHMDQIDEEGGTTDTATTENSSNKLEKDSGVGRTDESCRNDESSEQELLENDGTSPRSKTKFHKHFGNDELHYSNDSFTSNEAHDHDYIANDISAEECNKFREVLHDRCSSADNSPCHRGTPRKNSGSSIEHEIAILNQEMQQIELECQSIVEAHMREQQHLRSGDLCRTPRMVPRMGTKLEYTKQLLGTPEQADAVWLKQNNVKSPNKKVTSSSDKDVLTSAYNTGDDSTNRSTPLTLELNQVLEESHSMLHLPTGKPPSHSDSEKTKSNNKVSNKQWNSDGDGQHEIPKSNSNNSVSRMSQTQPLQEAFAEENGSVTDLYAQYADVMYTNKANLEHTIMVQQKLFEQQLLQKRGQHSSPSQNEQFKLGKKMPITPSDGDGEMRWVVKLRADGTRYIARRPVRNKMLKNRAKKISEERCGLTTDDDAVSEMKVGRYWKREERKRHIEKAKDHKKKKESIIKQKMETLKEKEMEDGKKEVNIVELSHRKMMRHKTKKVFDDFTTVQEMLAHGSRIPETKTYNPLLSVTTV